MVAVGVGVSVLGTVAGDGANALHAANTNTRIKKTKNKDLSFGFCIFPPKIIR